MSGLLLFIPVYARPHPNLPLPSPPSNLHPPPRPSTASPPPPHTHTPLPLPPAHLTPPHAAPPSARPPPGSPARQPDYAAACRVLAAEGAALAPLRVLAALGDDMPLHLAADTLARMVGSVQHRRRQGQVRQGVGEGEEGEESKEGKGGEGNEGVGLWLRGMVPEVGRYLSGRRLFCCCRVHASAHLAPGVCPQVLRALHRAQNLALRAELAHLQVRLRLCGKLSPATAVYVFVYVYRIEKGDWCGRRLDIALCTYQGQYGPVDVAGATPSERHLWSDH